MNGDFFSLKIVVLVASLVSQGAAVTVTDLNARIAAAAANAPYFDGVNFASLVRCPVRFLVGSVDEVAPPHAGFAAYNACPSADKEIRISLGFAHSPSPADRASQTNWLEDR